MISAATAVRIAVARTPLVPLLLLLLTLSSVAAARIGESVATVVLVPAGDGVNTVIEVETDPDVTRRRELTFFLNRRGSGERSLSVIVPPVEPGRYRIEEPLAAGEWNIAMRYGVGLDLYYAFVQAALDPETGSPQRRGVLFEGDLGADVPALVQPLGFAVFGLMAALALTLVVLVLRRLRRAEL